MSSRILTNFFEIFFVRRFVPLLPCILWLGMDGLSTEYTEEEEQEQKKLLGINFPVRRILITLRDGGQDERKHRTYDSNELVI